MAQYNLKNPAVKRLMKEAEELREPTEEYSAQPLEDNLFEWHFTLRGPPNSDFEGGIYHGRITLPPEYPMKPPSIILLTPNGRFEINKKICLSISGHHPETWQPSWSICVYFEMRWWVVYSCIYSPGSGPGQRSCIGAHKSCWLPWVRWMTMDTLKAQQLHTPLEINSSNCFACHYWISSNSWKWSNWFS